MNLRVLPTTDEDEVPPCFGQLWERTNPDCNRCVCFSACGQKMPGAKVEVPARVPGEVATLGKVAPQVLHSLGRNVLVDQEAPMPPDSLLSVPEPIDELDTPWTVLGRELLRGIGKSVGWTVANFFDKIPLQGLFRKK